VEELELSKSLVGFSHPCEALVSFEQLKEGKTFFT
jgi:hypothetical protein